MDTPVESSATLRDAINAVFPPEAQKLRQVRSFYEIRGQHRRRWIGNQMLINAYETALKSIAAHDA